MFTNRAPATLWRWEEAARDGPLINSQFYGVRVPLGALLCTMTNGLKWVHRRRLRECESNGAGRRRSVASA
jgi:hypothetical protein